jgi:putative membrane protein
MFYQQITNQLKELTDAYGAMERIKNTPLPFAYAIHLRTFLLLYLFLWNMISVAEYGWVSIPFLSLLNWALLGIEAAAVECESPFEYRENHLALGKVAVLISRNIGQALKELTDETVTAL